MLSKKLTLINTKKLIGSFKMEKKPENFNKQTQKMGRGVLQSNKTCVFQRKCNL